MSNIEPTPFGDKYVLVEHIATGGMAEIYRAHYKGIEGFAKELVIKVLREEFAERPDVVEMFLNEARVAATLTHNNVVHTYDLGELEGEYFIAMELLRGEELVDVLRRAHQAGEGIPLDVVCGITMQALEGLHYCHTRTGPDGKPLGLVHRDINPTNIHVGYDGVCKVLDFGIAATRASALAKGGIAGKLAYMAPEQALGQPIDARADIFAMGVVLYEMALGRRLFRGPRDEVLRRITEGDVPAPTFVQPDFPPRLEAIIMRALETDPADRYQNADHMFRDLEAFVQEQGLVPSARRVSAFMSDLFGEGKPADVDYDDEFDDLDDDSLDFAAYEAGIAEAGAGDEAPEWARALESRDAPAEGGGARRMTIGNLADLVAEEAEPAAPKGTEAAQGGKSSKPTSGGSRRGARGRTSGRKSIPRAAQPTKQKRRTGRAAATRRTSTSARPVVPTGATGALSTIPPGGTFGMGVVSEQSRRGSSVLVWLLAAGAIAGIGYYAYTVLTSK
ncbi:MAG: serine/threonine protein kinase [Deltaproteobacteria bacterium]|nr:MAG: serine/threonine protein kinase [Deltaproteobacteria bacterium]